jgi:hypothetical protein
VIPKLPPSENEYDVTWTVKITSTDPVSAAREAYEMFRTAGRRPTRFEVAYNHPGCELRYTHPVELGKENPLGRPDAVIDEKFIRCGHCESENTRYMEDVRQCAPLGVEDGVAVGYSADFERDELGEDPHVICLSCGLESKLPASFDWV